MINEKRKLKREHSNKMLKTISFSCPPEVLLIGNGFNRLLGLLSWQDLNETLKVKMLNSKLLENLDTLDTYKELSFPLQICALNTKSDDFYNSIEERMKEIKDDFEKTYNSKDEAIKNKIALYSKLCNLNFHSILTTNYDLFVEKFLTQEQLKTKSAYGRKNVTDPKKRNSLYEFKYVQHKKKGKTEQLDEPYVWHIHGNEEKPKNIMLDFYLYGTNISVIQSYGYHFIKKYMDCVKKEINNTSNESIMFQPESWLDYFFLGNVYIVGLGLDANEFELRWLLTYRKRIHNILSERIKKLPKKKKTIFGNIYFMDTFPTQNNINDSNFEQNALKEVNKRKLEFEILGCKYKNFCLGMTENGYEDGYKKIIQCIENRKTHKLDDIFMK